MPDTDMDDEQPTTSRNLLNNRSAANVIDSSSSDDEEIGQHPNQQIVLNNILLELRREEKQRTYDKRRERQSSTDRRLELESRRAQYSDSSDSMSDSDREVMNSGRRARDAENADSINSTRRDRRAENADTLNSTRRDRYAENAESINESRRENRATTADATNEYQRQYNEANAASINESRRQRLAANPESANATRRARAAALTVEQRAERNARQRDLRRARERRVLLEQLERGAVDINNRPDAFTTGLRDKPCTKDCGALLFERELGRSDTCCSNGKTLIPTPSILKPYPEDLKDLLLGYNTDPAFAEHPRKFHDFIRNFNSAFAFASMNCNEEKLLGPGPYVFRVHGDIRYCVSTLYDSNPSYCQLYVLEGSGAEQARVNNPFNSGCSKNLMSLVSRVLSSVDNPYRAAFIRMADIEKDMKADSKTVFMYFRRGSDPKRYNEPIHEGDVAAVFDGNSGLPEMPGFTVYTDADHALDSIKRDPYVLLSDDAFCGPHSTSATVDDLHRVDLADIPRHKLTLKIGCCVRLLSLIPGVTNVTLTTRLTVKSVSREIVQCSFDRGTKSVSVPRQTFNSVCQSVPFSRTQFPLKLDYSLSQISHCSQHLDPMVYPLLFPQGEQGWTTDIYRSNRGKVTELDFAQYRTAFRATPFSPLHYSRKLFQQYVVDCQVRIESGRLGYLRSTTMQDKFSYRKDTAEGYMEHHESEQIDPTGLSAGVPTVLPSSFTGGKRWMQQQYQDSMAMTAKFSKPDLFITFTCNPKHPDITKNLGNEGIQVQNDDGTTSTVHRVSSKTPLTASDRPDIVAATFNLHLKEFHEDLKVAFGEQQAASGVIEFQKRGLPHTHIAVWLKDGYKFRAVEHIDKYIRADIPDPVTEPELHKIVTTSMLHECSDTRCMQDGKCSKEFPKMFSDFTTFNNDGRVQYKRPDNGRTVVKNGKEFNNTHVVPYNPYLLYKFNAHINVEACMSVKTIKYMFKYIHKGYDCANIEKSSRDQVDEIKEFIDCRYISAPEAMWRIRELNLATKSHTVQRLAVHLPNQEIVYFRDNELPEDVLDRQKGTTLTHWFSLNAKDSVARQYLYVEIPYHYTYDRAKGFTKRKNNVGDPDSLRIIPRMYYVTPRDLERFYLRLLLLHVRGATSFKDLRTYNGTVYYTFEETCRARGLLESNDEWFNCLEEASITAMPAQLRFLFVTLLAHCNPPEAKFLWEWFEDAFSEDYVHFHGLTQREASRRARYDMNNLLMRNYGRVQYKRPDNGRTVVKNGKEFNNTHVVPYNPYLLYKFNAHINVEACMSVKTIKYMFKYIHKGYDCANIEKSSRDQVDEIKEFIDCRYISAPEAMWRIRELNLATKSHTVQRLAVHLPNQEIVYFRDNELPEDVLDRQKGTTLTHWFSLNAKDSVARQYLYVEIPYHYTYDRAKGFTKRKNNVGDPDSLRIIPRMYYVTPRDLERFYLRLLLLHVRGATSFKDLRTYNGTVYYTFEETCRARGLLESNDEWFNCLEEASITAMPAQLRFLFVTLLAHCNPPEAKFLWEWFEDAFSEDYVHFHGLTQREASRRARYDMNNLLMRNYRVPLSNFNITAPEFMPSLEAIDNDSRDEFDYMLDAEAAWDMLNTDQRFIADTLKYELDKYGNLCCLDRPRVYFIYASGGCGKTFLANTLSTYCKGNSLKYANCAWTGIAATLLEDGVTTHSLFKLPVPITCTSTCDIKPPSKHADYLRSLSIIFIDEASMIPLDALRAIDFMLRDITGNSVPFGGKLIVLAGDFRQTLPVTPKSSVKGILENCAFNSPLWRHVNPLDLTVNVRADPSELEFKDWLLQLGDGTLRSTHPDATRMQIDIPPQCNVTNDIVAAVFPDFSVDRTRSVIVTPLNQDVNTLNDKILKIFEPNTSPREYRSIDKVIEDDSNEISNLTTEFLNSVNPSGMPAHCLKLKKGCTVMLLRNLDSKSGLCNGTRLRVESLGNSVIEVSIISGNSRFLGKKAFIPRIKLTPSDSALPFKLQRLQFPLRLAYALTINKAQGQEFETVGIYLPSPVFSHGQLYVAFSRAKRFSGIHVHIVNGPFQKYCNISPFRL
eukprot:sb/3460557/